MGSGSSPPLTTVEWIPNESSPKNFKDKVRQLDPHTDTWQILNLELLEDIINIAKTVPLGGRLVKVPPSSTALASSAIHREHSLTHPSAYRSKDIHSGLFFSQRLSCVPFHGAFSSLSKTLPIGSNGSFFTYETRILRCRPRIMSICKEI